MSEPRDEPRDRDADGIRAVKPPLGGVVHTYLRYDPIEFPPPSAPPASGDAADAMLDHLLAYGSRRKFTDRELAEAIHLDPSQIAGLGPSLEAIRAILEARKRKILERYDPLPAEQSADDAYRKAARETEIPPELAPKLMPLLDAGQLAMLERAHRRIQDGTRLSHELMRAIARLRDRFA
ncbi:MAG: hypothetical protein ACO38W_03575, partial [Phycisphaerales bacterium]